MSKQIQIFDNPEFGKVRVIGDVDNPQFCLADVCKVLELPQVAKVVQRLDKEVLSRHPLETTGGVQEMYFVNEDGLYDVILDSRKPEAKRFRKWITSEVLPAVRKTGLYINPQAEISADFLRKLADAIDQRDKQIAMLNTQLAEAKPKADYCDLILQCPDLVTISVIAKDYGYSAQTFNKLLRELGIQYKQSGVWFPYQEYAQLGWTQTKTHTYQDSEGKDHCKIHMYWTQKGRLGLYKRLKSFGYLPLIEREVA